MHRKSFMKIYKILIKYRLLWKLCVLVTLLLETSLSLIILMEIWYNIVSRENSYNLKLYRIFVSFNNVSGYAFEYSKHDFRIIIDLK